MAPAELIGHEELDGVAARLKLAVDASELHGSLCGYLSGGGRVGKDALLAVLQLDGGEQVVPSANDRALLEQLVRQSEQELADPELGFEPLLPADDRPLEERADSLGDWCRGFLGGFGLAGPEKFGKLSDEAQEILRDLNTIAASEFEFGDSRDDEDALIELHEFVRVAAMLLHAECVGGRNKPNSDTVH
ncbi:UPF0149 family protein [Dyella sp. LX-66]|uniref:UPF0149 family protein n=1 Tax=unclassified Dyella TaxID=2634549 RepID=UPI001BDF92B0|nr:MULTISPECIES: UPF0149 family protein [unclassified Dyella]MBT2115760.1 UPF0149 family protein [Dyella sp. LX-1]MBT2139575.1 UPF0149 family protein [Dyella sp. LX-66]